MPTLATAQPQQRRTPRTVASSVPRGRLQRKCACGEEPAGEADCEACRKNHQLQRKAKTETRPGAAPPIVTDVLQSPGQPLDAGTRAFMEPRFGHDFSHVRLHADERAAESAVAVNALAYTVGSDVVFGPGQYSPGSHAGRRLVAHELAHVVQNGGISTNVAAPVIVDEHDESEREANTVGREVAAGHRAVVGHRSRGEMLHRARGDLVGYTGGQSGILIVLQDGTRSYAGPAVSGHPGHGENEPSEGPIPTGTYALHPGISQPTVAAIQEGICGAGAISRGMQEITSADPSPCSGAHYCNVPCPTPSEPGRTCFTPRDCWGPTRIKIEGHQAVTTPGGTTARRDGFYIHGGNPSDAISSGCIKSLDNGVFAAIRRLTGIRGAVPLCVGSACPSSIPTEAEKAKGEAVEFIMKRLFGVLGF